MNKLFKLYLAAFVVAVFLYVLAPRAYAEGKTDCSALDNQTSVSVSTIKTYIREQRGFGIKIEKP